MNLTETMHNMCLAVSRLLGRLCCDFTVIAFVFAVVFLQACGTVSAQLVAFPGAEGAGAFATGGRGGDVYVVTNLRDSGAGSLRHAVDTAPSTGRTVVFGVGGTINLVNDLVIDSPNLTIAGQTAPEGGITLARRMVRVSNTHDVILQHLRVRPGDYYTKNNGPVEYYEPDSIWVSGSSDIILDHISASWSTDEVISVTHGSSNVTVQWSLLTEALNDSYHSDDNNGDGGFATHGFGSIIHGGETTLHHNLYANNRSRNPATGNWDKSVPYTPAHLDIVNNVISNPGDRYSYSGGNDVYQVNWVGNYGVEGPDTTRENELFHPDNIDTEVYYSGNYYDTEEDGILQLTPASSRTLTGTSTQLTSPVSTTNPPVVTDAPLAYAQVLSYAGAAAWRDPIDVRIINDVVNQSGAHVDSQDDVGGWYSPPQTSHQLDPDGLPDAWKSANGFDPNDNSVGGQFAPDGYTYLEKYLHELNASYLPPQETEAVTVSTTVGEGADVQVGEIAGSATGGGLGDQLSVSWSAGARDDLVLLRFDLIGLELGSITEATLELTAFRDLGSDTIRVYGLKHEIVGQDWDESLTEMSSAPGVIFDMDSSTRDLNHDDLLLLGEFSTTGVSEGELVPFSNPDLVVFLNLLQYRSNEESIATIVLERQNSSRGETVFASKEADSLLSGGAAPVGSYAPRLLLEAVLSATALPGDYNNDGVVDATDYSVWRDNLGSVTPLSNETATPGIVDSADYIVWRSNYGSTAATSSSNQVPEPCSTVAVVCMLLATTGKRRGQST